VDEPPDDIADSIGGVTRGFGAAYASARVTNADVKVAAPPPLGGATPAARAEARASALGDVAVAVAVPGDVGIDDSDDCCCACAWRRAAATRRLATEGTAVPTAPMRLAGAPGAPERCKGRSFGGAPAAPVTARLVTGVDVTVAAEVTAVDVPARPSARRASDALVGADALSAPISEIAESGLSSSSPKLMASPTGTTLLFPTLSDCREPAEPAFNAPIIVVAPRSLPHPE
jgi:hypothetical protein